jgi:hypothetical protein
MFLILLSPTFTVIFSLFHLKTKSGNKRYTYHISGFWNTQSVNKYNNLNPLWTRLLYLYSYGFEIFQIPKYVSNKS